jgi:hypothetical protein
MFAPAGLFLFSSTPLPLRSAKRKKQRKIYIAVISFHMFVNVFISSTCYDLSQIRQNLSEAILQLGHNPILSEYNTFPVDPSIGTIENCIRQVNDTADLLVLIIGNRYGSILPSGRSITNMEYLTAKKQKIPIYVFIKEEIITLLSIYEVNETNDFGKLVDSKKIFEFVKNVKQEAQWYFPFSSAQDIVQILRTQLSYLFKLALETHTKLLRQNTDELFDKISGKAIQIILAKEQYWEYEYFRTIIKRL